MKFLNRQAELASLNKLLNSKEGSLGVLWGRRRIGKTRLLLEWVKKSNGLYWVADESSAAIQIRYFSEAISRVFPGFNDVSYPDWGALLDRLARDSKANNWRGPVVIDELPYLLSSSKELASIFQRWVDHDARDAGLVVVFAGSSQRMMQGLVLDENAPLYGRASLLMNLKGLPIAYIGSALGIKRADQMIEAYSFFGGVPRYWELATPYRGDIDKAILELVVDPAGVLHNEPSRLLLDEVPSAIQLRSLLDAIGLGANRLSEIASRLNQPSTSLSRSLHRLLEMGLIVRETSFGEDEKSTKRALYKIRDPFFRFWFQLVASRRSQIIGGSDRVRKELIAKLKPSIIQASWEELCRDSISGLQIWGREWDAAKRYWHGNEPEWDFATYSIDKKALLLGEVKWLDKKPGIKKIDQLIQGLISKGSPKNSNRKGVDLFYLLLLSELPDAKLKLPENVKVLDASGFLRMLKSRL